MGLAVLLLVLSEVVGAEAVEWMVADSDRIVRGRLVRVEGEDFTVDVQETLLGEEAEAVAFRASLRAGDAGAWRAGDAIFFLVRAEPGEFPGPEWALRRFHGRLQAVSLEEETPGEVYDTDFRVHRGAEAVLARVRALAAARGKDRPEAIQVTVPDGTEVFRRLWAGSSVYLVVPADAATEGKARVWVRSGAVTERRNGAAVLACRRSGENEEILRGLLRDAVRWEVRSEDRHVWLYPVRADAARALRAWGIDLGEVVTEEPYDR